MKLGSEAIQHDMKESSSWDSNLWETSLHGRVWVFKSVTIKDAILAFPATHSKTDAFQKGQEVLKRASGGLQSFQKVKKALT